MNKEGLAIKYTDFLLEEGHRPINVFKFCKSIKLEEIEFYQFFSSFHAIEKWTFEHFFENTAVLLNKDAAYESYAAKEKLLSFYYTYFELLNVNRSLVLHLLEGINPLQKMAKLKGLRSHFTAMVKELRIEVAELQIEKTKEIQSRGIQEVIWGQFMIILQFWLKDDSENFEKTDLFIEKTTAVGFDLVVSSPLENIMDLGKFLLKDKFNL
jgi:hypothetical protein